MTTSTKSTMSKKPLLAWLCGFFVSSVFSIAYLLIPLYLVTALLSLAFLFPCKHVAILYSSPIFLSVLIPPMYSKLALWLCRPMLWYFDFEYIHGTDSIPVDEGDTTKRINGNSDSTSGTDHQTHQNGSYLRAQMASGQKYLFAAQPHGILSYCGMCAAASRPDDVGRIPTAAASVVLKTPILKNLMGVFNLVDASAGSLKRLLSPQSGVDGVVLYIGGIAELFKSCPAEERLYLNNRKGFIKLALRQPNVDIVPIYMFGNTSVLSALKHGPLADISRRLQMSLTLFWGRWGLPVPRDEELLYVVGKPIGIPYIPEPKQEDIDQWHKVYCEAVRDIFETNKEKVPMYKHKKLYID